jgi:hypothetical protein
VRTLVILVLCLVACASAAGQDSQIFGLIRDPSSASVDGAEITLRNEQTGGVRNTRSNESGSYSLPHCSRAATGSLCVRLVFKRSSGKKSD